MELKAVLFDLGGTLVKTAGVPEIFRRILETYGVIVDSSEVVKAHKANEKEFDVGAGQVELGNVFWIHWNSKILRRLGVEKNVEFLAGKIDEQWWNYANVQFHHDVVKTLTKLKSKQVRMGIVTNWLRKDYEQVLQRLEAASYFDVVVGVDTCNGAKPDRKVFLCAVERLGLKPAEVLFIGDSIEKDYTGAERAGLEPLLIDREGNATEGFNSIRSLTDVLRFFQ